MDNIYILDIETRPQENLIENFKEKEIEKIEKKLKEDLEKAATYKKDETINAHTKTAYEDNKKALANIPYWKNMAVDPDYCDIRMIGLKEVGGESKLLNVKEFAKFIEDKQFITFVTFNGNTFDFNAIMKSAIKNNIKLPFQDLKASLERYPKIHTFKQIDLKEKIGTFGKYKSLDKYLQIYLGIAKKEIDFEKCTDKELEDHCIEDLENTEKLYNLFKELI